MGVHIVEVGGRDARALDRHAHAAECAIAVLRGGGDVMGVARQAIADEFGVDFRASRFGVLIFFQHDAARALAHDEAVAVLVIGARPLGGAIIETCG